MEKILKTHLIRIGNSKGIRIPKILLDQLGMSDEIELTVQENQLVVRASQSPRKGWEEQFKKMAEQGDDFLLDEETISLSSWDETEWEW